MVARPWSQIAKTLLAGISLSLLANCTLFAPPPVTRRVQGQVIEGPYVPREVYAAYLQGALDRARGDNQAAEVSFAKAAAWFPASAEIWVQLGAVRCAAYPHTPAQAFEDFARALTGNKTFARAYLERARCAWRTGRRHLAARDAMRAHLLQPQDPDIQQLWAEIHPQLVLPTAP